MDGSVDGCFSLSLSRSLPVVLKSEILARKYIAPVNQFVVSKYVERGGIVVGWEESKLINRLSRLTERTIDSCESFRAVRPDRRGENRRDLWLSGWFSSALVRHHCGARLDQSGRERMSNLLDTQTCSARRLIHLSSGCPLRRAESFCYAHTWSRLLDPSDFRILNFTCRLSLDKWTFQCSSASVSFKYANLSIRF